MLATKRFPGTAGAGRLLAQPQPGHKGRAVPGPQPLGLGLVRDGTLFVPRSYDPAKPAPLLLCLHGAGGHAGHRIEPLEPEAERQGILLLAPDSLGSTWDLLIRGFGPDVERLDRALEITFSRLLVDPSRVGIEGFSDGASYALSLGLGNGDLFSYIFAFSPGFMRPHAHVGAPRVLITHGTADPVLPVACSRRIVKALRKDGCETEYREFDGGHVVPRDALREAALLLAGHGSPADPL